MSGREVRLEPPLTEETVRALKVGDVVLINGPMVTGRDAAHHYLMHHDSPTDLRGAILYHCGPVMLKEGNTWRTNAAGPTTSIREEPYEADIIKRFGLRAVMGKGGMGKKTLAALKEHGAVYLHAIGGAAQFYARCLPKVHAVYLLEELGVPEAMWVFEARDFLAIVTMDAHGNSLHEDVSAATGAELERIGVRD
jgi:fumarate hydratase class I